MQKLELQLYFNWFSFQLISYFKPMHSFLFVFHKGGENSIFIFQLVFVFPLPYFMIENSHFNWYQDVYLKNLNWNTQNFWFVLPICKESLTSLLHIDSWWVYLVLKSITSLLYVVHVCRGSFTSPLMHYIMCVMWIRA